MLKTDTLHMNTELWKDTMPIYQKILDLPFIKELSAGTLSAKRFAHYIQQDALYLVDYSKALALIAIKANTSEDIISFLKFAHSAIVCERELHDDYFDYYKINYCEKKNSACFAYTHYLISTAATRSLEESVAAVLPCFWVYRDVGIHIHRQLKNGNPYEKWIQAYASEEFFLLVEEALFIAERMYSEASKSTQKGMRELALQSTLLEWEFWNTAYNEVYEEFTLK